MGASVENMNHENFQNVCRTCLTICDVKFFGDHVISNVFYKLTDIQFRSNDELPQQICLKCFEKINEIHEFAFQCKRSHSTLTNCLNARISEKQDVTDIPDKVDRHELVIKLGENIAINKETNTVVIDEISNPSNGDVNDELRTTDHDLEITHSELNENIIPETSGINGGLQKNCFQDVTSESDDFSSNDLNWSDLSEETCSSDSSASLIINSEKNGKKECNKSELKCENCNKTFKDLNTLKKHKKRSCFKSPYTCKQCSKTFTWLSGLKRHLRIHSGERPYKCVKCRKSFNVLSNLQQHVRRHNDDRPYKCKVCAKSFIQSTLLKYHMRIHSDERPFKCDQCTRSYSFLRSLLGHKRTHNNERPYKCDQCSKSYPFQSNLSRHKRTHSGERPYKCLHCSKAFMNSSHLARHRRTHSD